MKDSLAVDESPRRVAGGIGDAPGAGLLDSSSATAVERVRGTRRHPRRAGIRGYVVQEFEDVETAKRAGRTAFGEMVTFLSKNASSCRVLLVEKTGRLYRNIKDWFTIDERCDSRGAVDVQGSGTAGGAQAGPGGDGAPHRSRSRRRCVSSPKTRRSGCHAASFSTPFDGSMDCRDSLSAAPQSAGQLRTSSSAACLFNSREGPGPPATGASYVQPATTSGPWRPPTVQRLKLS